MPVADARRLAFWAAAALLLAALAALYLTRTHPRAAASRPPVSTIAIAQAGGDERGGGQVVVDVAGAVRRPGVYRLRGGARVEDALERAGGATSHADVAQINRAAKLEDGRQVLVPERVRGGAVAAAPGAAATPAQPIDLNMATAEQLDALDGVGPVMVKKILEYRTAHGGFGSVDELDQIPGIGEKRMAALREEVRV